MKNHRFNTVAMAIVFAAGCSGFMGCASMPSGDIPVVTSALIDRGLDGLIHLKDCSKALESGWVVDTYPDGRRATVCYVENGRLIRAYCFNPKGQKVSEVNDGNGELTRFYPDGSRSSVTKVENCVLKSVEFFDQGGNSLRTEIINWGVPPEPKSPSKTSVAIRDFFDPDVAAITPASEDTDLSTTLFKFAFGLVEIAVEAPYAVLFGAEKGHWQPAQKK